MIHDDAPEEKSRKPRAFTINTSSSSDNSSRDNSGRSGHGQKKTTAGNETAKAKQTRKPRTIKSKTTIRQTPFDAAQRHEGTTDEGAINQMLTPPAPAGAESSSRRKSGFSWSALFFSSLVALIGLGIGLWVDQLIVDLFARQVWLGWIAAGLTALLVVAALVLVGRELWGLSRMAKIDHMREHAARIVANNDVKGARQLSGQLINIFANRPDTARGRAALNEHVAHIVDGRDIIALAERDLIKPLDDQARRAVMASAKRVSVVTAVSPRAVLDIAFVLVENLRLIRRLADLYGGRPGTLGLYRLARNVVAHLAVTGSIAVGEGLIQQIVGQGLAAKLSSRLGEGVINGLLTARIGIAAIDICRPLPFTAQSRPSIRDFVGELTRFSDKPASDGDK